MKSSWCNGVTRVTCILVGWLSKMHPIFGGHPIFGMVESFITNGNTYNICRR